MTRTLAWIAPAFSFALVTSTWSSGARAQGLEPPPPMGQPPGYPGSTAGYSPAPPPPAADESDDSGLGLEWVYLNAEAGASFVDMQSFSASSFGLTKTSSG